MTQILPPTFALYRQAKPSCSCFVLVRASYDTGVCTLTPLPKFKTPCTVNAVVNGYVNGFNHQTIPIKTHYGNISEKRVTRIKNENNEDMNITMGNTIEVYPVYKIVGYKELFAPSRLRVNISITYQGAPAPAPAPAPALPPLQPTHASIIKKKVLPSIPTIQLFAAKQLFELARLKKEMCPITAEEYIQGETAVMPCGHLFMKMAIEETFKKEHNKCPSCRQQGAPTFV
jgi:hypothetical protein